MISQLPKTENHPVHCYDLLIQAMITDAIMAARDSEEDLAWIQESDMAEICCEVVGLDITTAREVAARIKQDAYFHRTMASYQGEINRYARTKVSKELKKEICRIYKMGGMTKTELAKTYGISLSLASRITCGKA